MALAPPTAAGQTATEGGVDFIGVDTGGGTFGWDIAPIPAATAASDTAAGVVELATDAEVTTGTATNLAVTPAGLKVELDKLRSISGQNLGTVATSAALDALADSDETAAREAGDWGILNVDEGGREAGVYVIDGTGNFPATPAYQFPDNFVAADATLITTLAGAGGSAATYARSDHQHAFPSGATLPALDGSGGVIYRLVGNAGGAADGLWMTDGQSWRRVG